MCAVLSIIYEQFSHGVYSPFMVGMFSIPLIGGAGVLALVRLIGLPSPQGAVRKAQGCGIATLTVASTLRGIFDIAGTSSPYLAAFVAVGAGFLLFAVVGFARSARGSQRRSSISSGMGEKPNFSYRGRPSWEASSEMKPMPFSAQSPSSSWSSCEARPRRR